MIKPSHESQELRIMARRLEELARTAERRERIAETAGEPADTQEALTTKRLLTITTALYKARRARSQFFGDNLFGEPAWDILLDLFICHLKGKPVSTSSLCIASAVPATTALRWIQHLTTEGLINREPCREDARVSWQTLTLHGAKLMRAYVEAHLVGIGEASLDPAVRLVG